MMDYLQGALVGLLVWLTGLVGGSGQLTDPTPVTYQPETAVVINVVDGDTIDVVLAGQKERVRYIGIDTPELSHNGSEADCYAEAASAANQSLVDGQTVTMLRDVSDKDKYSRLLRYVYVGDTFINQSLVDDGYAKAVYIKPDVSEYPTLKQAEATARANQSGLWLACY